MLNHCYRINIRAMEQDNLPLGRWLDKRCMTFD